MSDVSYERRKAVANAWKNEKGYVKAGKGTRDWSPKEQKQIINTGRAKGYQGHHMKSVDGHNSKAGDANNIQFLTRKEHLAAHSGDFHNNTNGYYDPKTGKMNSFGREKAHIEAKNLSNPVYKNTGKKDTNKKHEVAKEKAKSNEARFVNKSKNSKANNKKRVRPESKTLAKQRKEKSMPASAAKTESKTLAKQHSSASTKSKSSVSGASHGKKSNSVSKHVH